MRRVCNCFKKGDNDRNGTLWTMKKPSPCHPLFPDERRPFQPLLVSFKDFLRSYQRIWFFVAESVHEAAARRERSFRPIVESYPTGYPNPNPSQSLFDPSADVGKKGPVWAHERLFSPVPFSPAAASRPFTPVDFSANQCNTLPRGWRS